MREAVRQLSTMGQFPAESNADQQQVERFETLLTSVAPPLTIEEAGVLAGLLGPDEFFGGGWTILHLLESMPEWPIDDVLRRIAQPWQDRMRNRLKKF